MRLLLARHGQTTANAAGVLDSVLPGAPLTEHGRTQAEGLAERVLADGPVLGVYASAALRARQTAEPVARRSGHEVRVVDGVHETWLGDWDQRDDLATHLAFRDVYTGWHRGDLDAAPPNGESGSAVLARFAPVVDRLRAEYRDGEGAVVLVSHGAATRLVAASLAANIDGEFADAHRLDNCDTVLLVPDGDGWRCVRWGASRL